jgi:hypothetical protein
MNSDITSEPFRAYMKQVVTVHHVMFEKLLFQEAKSQELAQLFADAGRTYLEIAETIEKCQGLSESRLNNILNPES